MIGSGAMDVVLGVLVDVLVFLALVTVGLVLLAVVLADVEATGSPSQLVPVGVWGAATGLDSGDDCFAAAAFGNRLWQARRQRS
jgi:hypothetical protein